VHLHRHNRIAHRCIVHLHRHNHIAYIRTRDAHNQNYAKEEGVKIENVSDVILMTYFDDVTEVPSKLIFLRFNCVFINLQVHKLGKSRKFESLRRIQNENDPIFWELEFLHELTRNKIS